MEVSGVQEVDHGEGAYNPGLLEGNLVVGVALPSGLGNHHLPPPLGACGGHLFQSGLPGLEDTHGISHLELPAHGLDPRSLCHGCPVDLARGLPCANDLI